MSRHLFFAFLFTFFAVLDSTAGPQNFPARASQNTPLAEPPANTDAAPAPAGLLQPLERLTRIHVQLDLNQAPNVVAARQRADTVWRQLRRNQFLVGAAALTAGLFIAKSRNEWAIDEGYVGLAGAGIIGAGLLLDTAIPARWRR